MKKILIDTDIGDDVDDALAIVLAVNSPELEVVGITTVYKNVESRAQLAVRLLKILDRQDIPVYVGASDPLCGVVDSTIIPHQCVGVEKEDLLNKGHAVDFIIEQVKRDSKTIILGIGPLTNIALAIKLAPEIMKKAKIVLMGGAFSAIYPEYNIVCDTEATEIILNSGADVTMIGLDVTVHCVLKEKHLKRIKDSNTPTEKFLSSLVDIWMETSIGKKVTLHDPLTIAYVINNNFIKTKKVPVVVERQGSYTYGSTIVMDHPFRKKGKEYSDNATIGISVDKDEICDFVMNRVFP